MRCISVEIFHHFFERCSLIIQRPYDTGRFRRENLDPRSLMTRWAKLSWLRIMDGVDGDDDADVRE